MRIGDLRLVAAFCCPIAGCFVDNAPMLDPSASSATDTTDTTDPTTTAEPTTTSGGGSQCGDMMVQAGEQCDVGPLGNGACTDACQLNVCGDGYVGAGETCDGTENCVGCKLLSCGNGVRDAGEECDDGNDVQTDACAACKSPVCGDGFVQAGIEECDDGNQVAEDTCVPGCKNAACGDGIVGPGEACDDGNGVDDDACSNGCAPAGCGDGKVSNGEQCDDGNQQNDDACLASCQQAVCGDGVVWAGTEACDDGNSDDFDACRACVENSCGDGFLDVTEEQCDHGALNGAPGLAACSQGCERLAYAVFVTEALHTPGITFMGVAEADQLCTGLATSDDNQLRFKGSRWKAWLATALAGPDTTFFQSTVPYVKLTKFGASMIAANWGDLNDGILANPINTTEMLVSLVSGTECTAATAVWTGVGVGKQSGLHCDGWTSNAGELKATIGRHSSAKQSWTEAVCLNGYKCSGQARLYCFEQPAM